MVISAGIGLFDLYVEKSIINAKKSIFKYIRHMLSKKTKYGIKALAFIAKREGILKGSKA